MQFTVFTSAMLAAIPLASAAIYPRDVTTTGAALNVSNIDGALDAKIDNGLWTNPKIKLWNGPRCNGNPDREIKPFSGQCINIGASSQRMWFTQGRNPRYKPKFFSRPGCDMKYFVDWLVESGKPDQNCINVETYFQNKILRMDPQAWGRIGSISWNMD